MKRAIILNAVFVKGMMTPLSDQVRNESSKKTPKRRRGVCETTREAPSLMVRDLKTAGLWPEIEQNERDLLLAERVSERQRIGAGWLAESITCLLWALRMIQELPAYDQEADPSFVGQLSSITELVQRAKLRPKKEIEKQRRIAELWHWRARTRYLQEQRPPDGESEGIPAIEEIIEKIANRDARIGLLPTPIAGDFPALRKPYRDLSSQEFATLDSISQERHKAFNWLCGYSPTGRWEDTRTDT
jgi:hypothetical protein